MPSTRDIAARVVAFAAAATLSTTQELARTVVPALGEEVDVDLVAEETLALISTATARAVAVGLPAAPECAEVLLELPFLYHDYLLGASLVAAGAEGDVEVDQTIYDRLDRKGGFYQAHFPPGRYPGPHAVADKLPLWMGRISPPALATSPQERLAELGLGETLDLHLRLVLAFAKKV
ncbi:hypothetical protein BH23BAC4_BH23BAC4_06330 [soil metagenome]